MRIALCGAPDSGLLPILLALQGTLKDAFDRGKPGSVSVAFFDPAVTASAGNDAEARQCIELVFLMGLELPGASSQRIDQDIRLALERRHIGYTVLYGSLEERLGQALALIDKHHPASQSSTTKTKNAKTKPWAWTCDSCSDAACEHRLLTGLLASRTKGRNEPAATARWP